MTAAAAWCAWRKRARTLAAHRSGVSAGPRPLSQPAGMRGMGLPPLVAARKAFRASHSLLCERMLRCPCRARGRAATSTGNLRTPGKACSSRTKVPASQRAREASSQSAVEW